LTVFDYLFWYLQTFGRTEKTRVKSLKIPKEIIKDRQSQKDRQHKGQMFEDTKRDNQRPSFTEGQTCPSVIDGL
jgi:hypothetical protein